MNDRTFSAQMTRRQLLGNTGLGLGAAALGSLLNGSVRADSDSLTLPHFAAKAKRVIYLFQNGGPTHVDLFDYKPKLRELHNQPLPE